MSPLTGIKFAKNLLPHINSATIWNSLLHEWLIENKRNSIIVNFFAKFVKILTVLPNFVNISKYFITLNWFVCFKVSVWFPNICFWKQHTFNGTKSFSFFFLVLKRDDVTSRQKYSRYLALIVFKGNSQFIYLCNPQKLILNVWLMKILKSTVTKKVIVCFYN